MNLDFHTPYILGKRADSFRICLLVLVGLATAAGIIWGSAPLVWSIIIIAILLVAALQYPLGALTALAWYLPFEPFILKWVADDYYLYARYGSEVLIYILALVVIYKVIFKREQLDLSPLGPKFLLLVGFSLLSVLVNFLPVTGAILGLRQIFRFIILFFITLNLAPTKRFLTTLIAGLAVILSVQLALGFGQTLVGEPLDVWLLPTERHTLGEYVLTSGQVQFWEYGERVFGTLGRYDQLGIFISLVFLLLLSSRYEGVKLPWGSKITNSLLLASVPILVLTYSRSAWFGLLVGGLAIALYFKRDRSVLFATVASVLLLLGYLGISGLTVSRLQDSASVTVAERFFESFSVERWRGEYYGLGRVYWVFNTVTTVVPSAPLFGVGPGRYGGGAVAALRDTSRYDQLGLPFGVYGTEGYIDNNWFSLWGEIGTLGLGAYLWWYISLIGLLIYIYRQSNDPELKAWSLGMVGVMLAMFVHASLATFLEVRTIAPYIWILTGGVVGIATKEGLLKHYASNSRS